MDPYTFFLKIEIEFVCLLRSFLVSYPSPWQMLLRYFCNFCVCNFQTAHSFHLARTATHASLFPGPVGGMPGPVWPARRARAWVATLARRVARPGTHSSSRPDNSPHEDKAPTSPTMSQASRPQSAQCQNLPSLNRPNAPTLATTTTPARRHSPLLISPFFTPPPHHLCSCASSLLPTPSPAIGASSPALVASPVLALVHLTTSRRGILSSRRREERKLRRLAAAGKSGGCLLRWWRSWRLRGEAAAVARLAAAGEK